MSLPEPLIHLIIATNAKISDTEKHLLETEAFIHIYQGLRKIFRSRHHEWFQITNISRNRENTMLDTNFLQLLIQDIIATGEYTLEGITRYTGLHQDLLQEIVSGKKPMHSLIHFYRLAELHQSVRSDLYSLIQEKYIKKIKDENTNTLEETKSEKNKFAKNPLKPKTLTGSQAD